MNDAKVVVFDLGKVLLDFDYSIAAAQLARESAVSARQIQSFIDHSPLLAQYEKGLIDRERFFEEIRVLTQYQGGIEDFYAMFSAVFTPIEPMIELQSRLVAAGVPTFIFSNTNDLAIAHIRQAYPFYSRFDGYVVSYEHGYLKPEPPFYRIMEEVCGHTTSSICYLDDREENVAAGLERGWRACVHRDPAASAEWLRQQGLHPVRVP